MNRKILIVLIAGASIIAATAWLTYPGKPARIRDSSNYRYLHCPQCKREKMFSPSALDQKCLYCDKEQVPTEESIAKTGVGPSPFARMFLLIFAELLAIMAAFWLVTRRRGDDGSDEFLYFNCEKCRQRIRYRLQQIGQSAACRRCKHPFVYPEEDTDES